MAGHRVQFHDSEAFLLRKVVEFMAPLLDGGGGALVIAAGPRLRRLEALLASKDDAAGAGGAGRAGASDRLVCVDGHETLAKFMVDGLPDERRFTAVVGALLERASAGGTRRVGAFGDMVAVLCGQGNAEAAVRLERLWEDAVRRLGFDLLCAYPMSAFPERAHRAAFEAICDSHTHVEPLESVADAAAEADRLHRLVAGLQQAANSLQHEAWRQRRSDRLLGRQAARICAMERTQAALKTLAGHDALTGLSNRRAFTDRLSHAFARARRARTGVALLFVDLDDFKALNDRFGHAAGDRLLREAGTRLARCVRTSDTVCRLGGDEFTVLMEEADAAEAARLAQRVVDALAQPFTLGSAQVGLTASVGISLYPDDAPDAQTLLSHADDAMYRAKALGKGRYAASHDRVPGHDGEAADDAARPADDGAADATTWLTVEAAALRLELSRPHVVKLIVERRFDNVVRQAGALPLIPATEVNRVAREMALAQPSG